jgi:hypothetical protein
LTTEAPAAPVIVGPTWQRDTHGDFVLPQHTLGWQILDWTGDYLQHPDGPDAGKSWRFTDEQARFVLWWFAVDEQGRFQYRAGMLRRMKGWGKDPVAAVLAAIEFVGPSRFSEFIGGEPFAVARQSAWVQIAAVSRDQTRNTLTLFPGLFSPLAIDEYSIDLGKEIIYAHHGRERIEAVTSSPRALEGGRSTFVIKNESHHWLLNNEGHEMSATIARNAAKVGGRVLAISNAHNPGENSDAERDWEAYRKTADKLSPGGGFLYDCLEAPDVPDLTDMEALRHGLLAARGDSVWLDVERLAQEIVGPPGTPAPTARRYYLNQITSEEDKPFSREKWDKLRRRMVVPDGDVITLGFDGSISRDWTACVATHVKTGYQWPIGIWEPRYAASGRMEIPIADVNASVTEAFSRWNVWRLYGDPYYWTEQMAAWAGRFGDDVIVEWKTTTLRKMAYALLAYRNAIDGGELTHNGDLRFASAIGNAQKHMQTFTDDLGEPMWTIEKERPDSPLKIDPAIAGCLSWQARLDAIASGVLEVQDVDIFFI